MQTEKRRFRLTYADTSVTKPLIWEMSRKFDLIFNIRGATIVEGLGLLAIELEGPTAVIEKAVRWLQRKGVHIDPVELSAIEG